VGALGRICNQQPRKLSWGVPIPDRPDSIGRDSQIQIEGLVAKGNFRT
jgi:hypothetical protein